MRGCPVVDLSESHCVWFQVVSQLPAMVITIEFIWRINGFRDVWFKRLTYAAMALFNIGVLIAFTPAEPSAICRPSRWWVTASPCRLQQSSPSLLISGSFSSSAKDV